MKLQKEDFIRYGRQMLVPGIGQEGQDRLKRAGVLVVGAGGLGSPALLYLAGAGVGRIGIVDDDIVELSNLHRQVIHGVSDLGHPKTGSVSRKLRELNPDCLLEEHPVRLTGDNADAILERYDAVLDGTDTFSSKFLVNDRCVRLGKPFVHGGVFQSNGQVMTWTPGHACVRCVFREAPPEQVCPSCEEAGVLGPVAGLMGMVQTMEILKILTGYGRLLTDRLLVFEGWEGNFREVPVRKDPACPACGAR